MPAHQKGVIECLRFVLHVLDHALHQFPQRAVVDYVLNADPPTGVRVSSSTIGVDRGLPHLSVDQNFLAQDGVLLLMETINNPAI